jgi:hypothetical protein
VVTVAHTKFLRVTFEDSVRMSDNQRGDSQSPRMEGDVKAVVFPELDFGYDQVGANLEMKLGGSDGGDDRHLVTGPSQP